MVNYIKYLSSNIACQVAKNHMNSILANQVCLVVIAIHYYTIYGIETKESTQKGATIIAL